jgi:hypothetical protein
MNIVMRLHCGPVEASFGFGQEQVLPAPSGLAGKAVEAQPEELRHAMKQHGANVGLPWRWAGF